MTYDLLCDTAAATERDERLTIAESIISEARGDADAELIAQGEICRECGERFQQRQGVPTVCRDCGGTAVAGSNWYAEDRYYAHEGDAEFWRHLAAMKRRRLLDRIARFESTRGRSVQFCTRMEGATHAAR